MLTSAWQFVKGQEEQATEPAASTEEELVIDCTEYVPPPPDTTEVFEEPVLDAVNMDASEKRCRYCKAWIPKIQWRMHNDLCISMRDSGAPVWMEPAAPSAFTLKRKCAPTVFSDPRPPPLKRPRVLVAAAAAEPPPPPPAPEGERPEETVQRIVRHRHDGQRLLFCVEWVSDPAEVTWEPLEHLYDGLELNVHLHHYLATHVRTFPELKPLMHLLTPHTQ